MTALFLGVAGVATWITQLLPRWTAWLAFLGAALCLVFVPTMYAGPVAYDRVYNVGGFAPALVANFPPALWFAAVRVFLLTRRA